MAGQSILTDSFRGTDVSQFNWLFGTSKDGSLPPILTARSTSTASPGGIPGGGTDQAGNGALRLTNNQGDQGSFVIYNQPINSSAGLSVQFDLYSYGGTGADGISFFLIDGNATPTTGGAVGGSLGYSSNTSAGVAPPGGVAPGIVGGYLGIGFDEFGNFSAAESGANSTGQAADSIAVRGRASLNYPLLTSVPVGSSIDVANITSRTTAKRLVGIDLTSTGVLSVSFDSNNNGTFEQNERLISGLDVTIENGALPSTFKFGFAASTAAQTNFHEVNNLQISTFAGNYTPLVSFLPIAGTLTPQNSVNVTAQIDVASTVPVTIPLIFGGTAGQGDYTPSATSITIAPGDTTGSITLFDTPTEAAGKNIQVSFGTPTNAIGSPQNAIANVPLGAVSFGNNNPYLNWYNPDTGLAAIWALDGSKVVASGLAKLADGTAITVDPIWTFVNGDVDFNVDGIPDFVWFNTVTTETAIWYMQPGSDGVYNLLNNVALVTAPGATTSLQPGDAWELVGVSTQRDGTPTLVWEDTNVGAAAIWELDVDLTTGRADVNLSQSAVLTDSNGVLLQTGGGVEGWQIAGAGDFGGSGTQDLLWFNTITTQTAIWQMNGTVLTQAGLTQFGGATTAPGAGWRPVAIGNVDDAGTDEIIWQNGTALAVWEVGSNFALSARSKTLSQTLDTGEVIDTATDIDLDGTLDLLARQINGTPDTTRVYTLDPTTFQIATPSIVRYLTLGQQPTPILAGDPDWEIVDTAIVDVAVS